MLTAHWERKARSQKQGKAGWDHKCSCLPGALAKLGPGLKGCKEARSFNSRKLNLTVLCKVLQGSHEITCMAESHFFLLDQIQ